MVFSVRMGAFCLGVAVLPFLAQSSDAQESFRIGDTLRLSEPTIGCRTSEGMDKAITLGSTGRLTPQTLGETGCIPVPRTMVWMVVDVIRAASPTLPSDILVISSDEAGKLFAFAENFERVRNR
jgi:hypothetical protein